MSTNCRRFTLWKYPCSILDTFSRFIWTFSPQAININLKMQALVCMWCDEMWWDVVIQKNRKKTHTSFAQDLSLKALFTQKVCDNWKFLFYSSGSALMILFIVLDISRSVRFLKLTNTFNHSQSFFFMFLLIKLHIIMRFKAIKETIAVCRV